MQLDDNNDADRGDFVCRTVAELIHRGTKCPGGGDASPLDTLRWFDYFVEFFLHEREGEEDDHSGRSHGHGREGLEENGREKEKEEDDDILYFVPANQPDEQEESSSDQWRLLVKRRPVTGTLPPLEAVIQWEETFVINLLARLRCQLRLTVVEAGGRIVSESLCRVYADPMRGQEPYYQSLLHPGRQASEMKIRGESSSSPASDSTSFPFCPAYPMVYFHCHGIDETDTVFVSSGQTLCVELLVLFKWRDQGGGKNIGEKEVEPSNTLRPSSPLSVDRSYVAWRTNPDSLPLFQGAVSHEALRRVHRKKVGLHLGASSGILMRGPSLGGENDAGMSSDKSFAQIVVRTVDAPSLPVHLWRKLLRRGSETGTTATTTTAAASTSENNEKRQLQCQLRFIYMNWRPLARAIFQHRHQHQHPRRQTSAYS